ncbi:MAG TPA: SRPBCC domain-containing protein [Gammaproteobacteria bacterium]|nr:SRPBCC domain-containing protein [Gammaproteobacteria bacterium]
MKKQIFSEIVIAAPVATVWAILARTADYSDWNPFIRRIDGSLDPGGRLSVVLALGADREITIKPRLIRVLAQREIRWIGRMGIAGLFDGEHSFAVEPEGAGTTRFIHQETFSGLLVPFLWPSLKPRVEKAFADMNSRLKQRAEAHTLPK